MRLSLPKAANAVVSSAACRKSGSPVGSPATVLGDKALRLRAQGRICAKSLQPANLGLAAEPGELTLGIVAVTLAGGGNGLLQGQRAGKMLHRLAVAQGVKHGCSAIASNQLPCLFNQALGKHGARTGVEALVKLRTYWIQAEAQDAVASQCFPPFLPGLRHGTGSGQGHLDGSYDLRSIVGVDAGGRGWVEALEDAV